MSYKRAGALILNDNLDKCLMVFQKSSNLWGIPKGRKEDNEDTFICMLREVREEVGLNLNHIKIEVLETVDIHSTALIYILRVFLNPLPICCPPFEDNNDNHEIEKIEWVSLPKAYSRNINSVTRYAFQDLKRYLNLL